MPAGRSNGSREGAHALPDGIGAKAIEWPKEAELRVFKLQSSLSH